MYPLFVLSFFVYEWQFVAASSCFLPHLQKKNPLKNVSNIFFPFFFVFYNFYKNTTKLTDLSDSVILNNKNV